MSKITNVRLPNASATYDPSQINQLVRSLEQVIFQLNNTYTSIVDQNVVSAEAWYGDGVGIVEGTTYDYIDFNTSGVFPRQLGRIGWNVVDETLDIGMEYGVVQQVGEEVYARVRNETGSTIPNGTVVGFAGAGPFALKVAPYLADGSQPSLYILGVMTHDLPDSGDKGYCTVWGFVRDVDTSAFSVGDVLYASPTVAGGFTNVKPTAPNNVIPLAAVVQVGTTDGVIFVRPTIEQSQDYGRFNKTDNQSAASSNTAYAILLTGTEIANGVTLGSPASRIVVAQSGYYEFNASFQLSSSNASAKNFRTWVRKNGVDIANSARVVTNDINGGYLTFATTRSVSLAANDYVELMFSVTDTAISLTSVPSTAWAPGAPAVILSVTQSQL